MRVVVATGLVMALFGALAAGCNLTERDGFWSSGAPSPSGRNTRDAGAGPPRGPQPDFGPTRTLADAPPSISGGTLIVTRDGRRAVAADPDRDLVYVVDLGTKKLETTVTLEHHDEPGRVVEDGAGRFHVALRRGGAIVTITLGEDGPAIERREVCPAPRGLAFDGTDRVFVACEGGELLALPAGPGEPVMLARLERDLRDVVVTKRRLFVSTFRSARMIELSHEGAPITSARLPAPQGQRSGDQPMAAFRMIAAPPDDNDDDDDDPVIVHEAARPGSLSTRPGGYYGAPPSSESSTCSPGSVVHSAISRAGARGGTRYLPSAATLPVDIATDGRSIAVIAAGNAHTRELPQLYFAELSSGDWSSPCSTKTSSQRVPPDLQLTSVAFRGVGAVAVQSREPARLVLLPEDVTIPLSEVSREDTGHAIFHSNAGVGAACASCHPEGGDDGRTWEFQSIGARRTPSLRGTLAGTAPFHWDGDMIDIAHLADDVLSSRMSGPRLDDPQKSALESWLFAIPAPKPSVAADADTIARGSAVFRRSDVGCTTCHDGPMLTNGSSVDVGTGGAFQVPSLIGVASRAPLMHDGCANTIRERFSIACGGARHGKISQLDAAEIDELIAYLESL